MVQDRVSPAAAGPMVGINGRIHYGLEVHLCEMDADAAQPAYTRCKVKYFDNWRL